MNLVVSVPFCRCRTSAVSTHYKASPHAARARPWTGCLRTACAELRRMIQNICPSRSKRTSASFRLRWTSLTPCGAACVGYQPTVWWSVQESNLRQPDSESGALPTELTDVDVLWSEPIHGTDRTKPCRVTCMPLDRQHQRPLRGPLLQRKVRSESRALSAVRAFWSIHP